MKKPLLIVELAGPAGVGKSTLTRALSESNANIRIGEVPYIRDGRNSGFYLWNALLLFPVFAAVALDRSDRALTPQQMVAMTILRGWRRRLRDADSGEGKVIVLDQGPVHMLSDLLRFGHKNLRSTASSWWDRTCRDWAEILDVIVCLDAPDHLLLKRVRTRETKNHRIKTYGDEEAVRFLAMCRRTQNETLSSLRACSRELNVVEFDTSQLSLGDTIEKIRTLFLNSIKKQR